MEDADQQMLGPDKDVVEPARLVLSDDHDAPSPLREALEHA